MPSKVGHMILQQITSMTDISRWGVQEFLSHSNFISIDPMCFKKHLDGFHLTVNKNDQFIPAVLIWLGPLTLSLFVDTVQSFCYHTLTHLKLMSSLGQQERKYRLQGDIYLSSNVFCCQGQIHSVNFPWRIWDSQKISVFRKCLSCTQLVVLWF